MALQIIELGMVEINFGVKHDSERVKKVVGSFPSKICLDAHHFPHIQEWPEGKRLEKLGIARFRNERFENIHEARERLKAEGLNRLTVIIHLACGIIPRCNELAERNESENGPAYIVTTDPSSDWLDCSDGIICVPNMRVLKYRRGIHAYSADVQDLPDGNGFLVVL